MPKRHDEHEERAIAVLGALVRLSETQRDALPGSAVKLIKQARAIMVKRRHPEEKR